MNTNRLNGYETLKKLQEGVIPKPTMAATIPMTLTDVGRGTATFRAVAGTDHLNPMGGVHGGFAATVLDSSTGCAVHTMLGPEESYGTIDLNIKMLKAVPVGKQLFAKGIVLHISKRLGVSESSLVDSDGTVYAHATATCMIYRKKTEKQSISYKTECRATYA